MSLCFCHAHHLDPLSHFLCICSLVFDPSYVTSSPHVFSSTAWNMWYLMPREVLGLVIISVAILNKSNRVIQAELTHHESLGSEMPSNQDYLGPNFCESLTASRCVTQLRMYCPHCLKRMKAIHTNEYGWDLMETNFSFVNPHKITHSGDIWLTHVNLMNIGGTRKLYKSIWLIRLISQHYWVEHIFGEVSILWQNGRYRNCCFHYWHWIQYKLTWRK